MKSPAELAALRASARFSDYGVERLLAASYHGVSELELFSQGRAVQLRIMRELVEESIDIVAVSATPDSACRNASPELA